MAHEQKHSLTGEDHIVSGTPGNIAKINNTGDGLIFVPETIGSGLPTKRYIYLVQDAADAATMGGTASNTYTTAQAAYDAAVALQALNGGIVIIRIGNITQALAGDITLTANLPSTIRFEGINRATSNIRDIISNGFTVTLVCNDLTMRNIVTTSTTVGNASGLISLSTYDCSFSTINANGNATSGNGGQISVSGGNSFYGAVSSMSTIGNGGPINFNALDGARFTTVNSSSANGNAGLVGISSEVGACIISTITANGGGAAGNGGAISADGQQGVGTITITTATSTGAGSGHGGNIIFQYVRFQNVSSIGGTTGGCGAVTLIECTETTIASGTITQTQNGASPSAPNLTIRNSTIHNLTQNNNHTGTMGSTILNNVRIRGNFVRTAPNGGTFTTSIVNVNGIINAMPLYDVTAVTDINLELPELASVFVSRTVRLTASAPATITNAGVTEGEHFIVRFKNNGTEPITFVNGGQCKTKSGNDVVLEADEWIEFKMNEEYNSSIIETVNMSNVLRQSATNFYVADWAGAGPYTYSYSSPDINEMMGMTVLNSANVVLPVGPAADTSVAIVGDTITITTNTAPFDGKLLAYGFGYPA